MRVCFFFLSSVALLAANRQVESIGQGRHEYQIRMGGNVDAAGTRDPVIYEAWRQVFEPMRAVRLENVGKTDVVNPWISVNGKRNWRSTGEIAAEALRTYGEPGRMSSAEKARAVWEFLRRHRFHATTGDFEVRDPVKVFNVYGFALCGDNAPVLMDLWRAVGIPSRRGFPMGHCVSEAWYDGGWHLLDADEAILFLDRDNRTISSERAVARDHDLARRAYPDETLPALYNYDGSRAGDYPSHVGHRMEFTLRPGESIEWRWGQGSRFHSAPKPGLFLLGSNDLHRWGPKAWATLRNGLWSYTPRLNGGKQEWTIRTPYVIVGGRIRARGSARVLASRDGREWKAIDELFPNPGTPCYEFQVRAEGPLEAITIEAELQMAPLAMPSLELGENRILYTDQSTARSVRATFEWEERTMALPPAPTGGQGAFAWSAVPGAAEYHFQLSDEQSLRWPLSPAFEQVVKESRISFGTGLLNPGQRYYWRVRARSAEGAWGPWSATWEYVPSGPSIAQRVRFEERRPDVFTLAWEPAPGAVRYRIYGSDEKGFTPHDRDYQQAGKDKKPVNFPANFVAESEKPSYDLNPSHAFYRVIAVDSAGLRGGASDYAEAPRPWIYTTPVTRAKAGERYWYEARTIRSIGSLGYHEGYQADFWDVEEPRFSLETEMPRCGNFPPKWLEIDSKTGVLSGIAEPGEYQVNVRVEIHGRSHVQSFPLIVTSDRK